LKNKVAGGHVNRNAQFENITTLRALYTVAGNPVLSVDSKKRTDWQSVPRWQGLYH